MMSHTEAAEPIPTSFTPRTVAIISTQLHSSELAAILRTIDCQVVFVASVFYAYSEIKRAIPDLIVACLGVDDLDGWQAVSMLKLDGETSGIPVLTHVTSASDALTHDPSRAVQHVFGPTLSLN